MSAAVAYSPHEDILRTLPHPPVLGRRIYFCVEEPANIFSAIRCALEHLAQSPKDQITVVSVVQTEAQREVAISTTWSLMKIIEQQTRSYGSNLLLHILLAPLGSFAKLACESVSNNRGDLLILGLSGNSLMTHSSGYCIKNSKCQVVIKRLTSAAPSF
ncbi:hypothetical protein CcCBS67573_g03384 [Chytriomyces confervae]|uniref:UspA domain-containing protein n=1 Tax=Chytriomyces confervae TaxID=246404 RepID=A0A507FG65_9FUNG|nr:hypothetical protein CcCBS67573_g03384 [Chytriomyces confervae]